MKQFSKDLGNVSLAPKGRWSKEQEYERLNLVYNACDNLSYVAKINVPSGVDIENREYWQPMNATGYADNNFINLTTESETGTVTAYESLEEAVATILPINRRAGATLSFYNLNADRLDRQAEFELWQFNSTDLANWENKDYWNNIYYNWNVFAGWYVGADALKNHVKIPNVGQYAYVGSNLNDAVLYQCRTNGTWTNTGIKVRNYISVVVSGNITIGENGNWFSDGKDTGIPATPAVDEHLDNIIMRLQQHDSEINNLKLSDANLQDQITSNDSDITSLTAKHESLSKTVQGIAATSGASTATNVTYDNDASGLNAENIQDAIDELQGSKIDKTSILQESGEAEDKVMSQKAVSDKLSELSKSAFNYQFFLQADVSFKFDLSSFLVTMRVTAHLNTVNLGYFYENGDKVEKYATLESRDVTFTIKNFSYLYVDLEDYKVKVSESDLLSYDNRLVLLVNFRATSVNDFKFGMLVPYLKKNYIGNSIVQTTGESEDKVMSQKAVSDNYLILVKASYRFYSQSKSIVAETISQHQISITISTNLERGQVGWLSHDSINAKGIYNEDNELTKTYVLNHSDLLVANNSNGILTVLSYNDYSANPTGYIVLAYLQYNKIVGVLNEFITSENAITALKQIDKKFDKSSIVQELGEAEDKVMSQKAVSDKLSELSKSAFNYDNIIRTIQRCGYSGDGAPFQTLQAYSDAIKHGFSILLADLMFTKDNVPVCSHDYYLNQYYSNVYNSDGNLVDKSLKIYIREKTYEELLAYDWGAGKYKGTKLLKFEDFVKFCKINGVSEMYVEIKELTSDIQASIACDIVKKYSMKKKTSFASTEGPLKRILTYLPYARVATMPSTINDNTINELLSLNNGKCKLFFFAWDTTTLSKDIVKKLIENNIDFEFGTLNTKEKVKEYFNKDNIYLYCTGVESDSLHIGNVLKELEI